MTGQDLLDTRIDPYAALGAKLDGGLFLKFSKGEYIAGQNKEELRLGKRLVVNIPGMQLGWVRWSGGKPVENRMALLIERRRIESRDELSDSDESLWERDDRGDPQDPWVLTYSVEMSDPANSEVYSFSTTSKGGEKAIGKLLKAFGPKHRMEPHLLPIVELQRESYEHANKRFGKIYNPLLPIIGWTDADNPSVDVDDPSLGEPGSPAAGQRAANPTQEVEPTTATTASSTRTRSHSSSNDSPRF